MALLIILVAAIAFIIYLALCMYYGRDARIEMFWLNVFLVLVAVGLGVLLWLVTAGDYAGIEKTAALASLAGVLALVVRYVAVEFKR